MGPPGTLSHLHVVDPMASSDTISVDLALMYRRYLEIQCMNLDADHTDVIVVQGHHVAGSGPCCHITISDYLNNATFPHDVASFM